jgi:hypothetical protein
VSQTKAQLLDGSVVSVAFSAGSVGAPSLYFTGDTNTGIYSPGADQIAFVEGGVEALRIDSSGRLLVGTSVSDVLITSALQIAGTGFGGTQLIKRYADVGTLDSAQLALLRTRGSTAAARTLVLNGDELGQISFAGTDGSTVCAAASITASVDGTPGANDMPGRLVFSTTADGAASTTERMRINSSGNVGIGTMSPGTILDVGFTGGMVRAGGASGNNLIQAYTGFGGLGMWAGGSTRFYTTGNMTFSVNSTIGTGIPTGYVDAMTIDSSGRLLVGTSTARSSFFNASVSSDFLVETTGTGRVEAAFIRNESTSFGSGIVLGKSRGTSAGSNVIVASGDNLGVISFQGANGTSFTEGASITAQVDGTPGANDMPGRLVFSTTADGAASATERMRIDSSGRLLVGTSSGSALLQVNGTFRAGIQADSGFDGNNATILSATPPSGTRAAEIHCFGKDYSTFGANNHVGLLIAYWSADTNTINTTTSINHSAGSNQGFEVIWSSPNLIVRNKTSMSASQSSRAWIRWLA